MASATSERDHHFDRAGELDDVGGDFVLVEILLRDARESSWRCGSPARSAGCLILLSSGTQIASRQLPMPSAKPSCEIDARFIDEVAAGDAHVDRAFAHRAPGCRRCGET